MLEVEGALQTWAIQQLPAAWAGALGRASTDPSESVEATRLADHRLEYLEHEGPVSGDRGHVTRVDGGEYQLLKQNDSLLQVRLVGTHYSGLVELAQDKLGWRLRTGH